MEARFVRKPCELSARRLSPGFSASAALLLAFACGPAVLPHPGRRDAASFVADSGASVHDSHPRPDPEEDDAGLCSTERGDVIVDFEQGTGLRPAPGRSGGWYVFNDGTSGGVQVPAPGQVTHSAIPGGRCDSSFALRISGHGFVAWGAGAATDFAVTVVRNPGVPDQFTRRTYDASAYRGISFWARAEGTAPQRFRFQLADSSTDIIGGSCTSATSCGDHFGADLFVGSTWRRFELPFAQLTPTNPEAGHAREVDATTLYTVLVTFAPGNAFDLWIDDVAFLR